MFGFLRAGRGEYLQDWIDWIETFDDEIIFTATGGLLRVAAFEPPDLETFPLLRLARQAGESGGTYPCVYNAANEVAVQAFFDGRLSFLGIADAVDEALTAADGAPARDLDELTEADTAARRVVARV